MESLKDVFCTPPVIGGMCAGILSAIFVPQVISYYTKDILTGLEIDIIITLFVGIAAYLLIDKFQDHSS
jgi:uncharacterized protein with PQ loop repeat